jgi:hypothetical protein
VTDAVPQGPCFLAIAVPVSGGYRCQAQDGGARSCRKMATGRRPGALYSAFSGRSPRRVGKGRPISPVWAITASASPVSPRAPALLPAPSLLRLEHILVFASCSEVRASWHWPKVCKTRCRPSAELRCSIAARVSRPSFAGGVKILRCLHRTKIDPDLAESPPAVS